MDNQTAESVCSTMQECDVKAENGDAVARYRLGQLYEEGAVVKQNYARAAVHYQIACVEGYKQACERLKFLQKERLEFLQTVDPKK